MGNLFSKSINKSIPKNSLAFNYSLYDPLIDDNNIVERIKNLEDNVKLLSEDLHAIKDYLLNHQPSSK